LEKRSKEIGKVGYRFLKDQNLVSDSVEAGTKLYGVLPGCKLLLKLFRVSGCVIDVHQGYFG